MAERGARLLVADDNKVNRLLLTRNLELQGHRVASAANGLVALEMLRAEAFDLLLLDMEMPELDGFQVLEQMVGDARLRDIPVIVTSSLEGVAHVARCIELGADDYLPKPVNPVLLKARIDSSLEKKRLRDQQHELIKRFATSEVVDDLRQSGFALGGRRVRGTVMFCDFALAGQWFAAMDSARASARSGAAPRLISCRRTSRSACHEPFAESGGSGSRMPTDSNRGISPPARGQSGKTGLGRSQ